MSSIRFTSFGAATVPLSKIVVDKDLDMGPYAIKGLYRPEGWRTSALDWGDVPPTEVVTHEDVGAFTSPRVYEMLTADSQMEVLARVTSLPIGYDVPFGGESAIRVNNVSVYSLSGLMPGSSKTTPPLILKPGDVLTARIHAAAVGPAQVHARLELIYTGRFVQGREFDLTGKWLALGIDMHGLEATIDINGINVPYADYAKYFPIAPTKITISDEWDLMQVRPEILVYD